MHGLLHAITRTLRDIQTRLAPHLLRWLVAVVAAGLLAWVLVLTSLPASMLLYLLYIAVSLLLGVIGTTTLMWMLYAWRNPGSFTESRLRGDEVDPANSFSLIIPARHESAVLETTIKKLLASDHPAFEVIVVVGDDDSETRDVADLLAEHYPSRLSVVVDSSSPKNKPRALNAGLPHCRGAITGVFDAEDDVHPLLLRRVDQCFQRDNPDIVQAGVQLMNFRSSWLTVHNVLEYYFWFRSRLHRHASQRFIPLGGNTVFIRSDVLKAASGWDSECLAEDCELGVRLSAQGARTTVFYEPEVVTREECPPTLRAFVRQRTRWNQGYLQTLSKGVWRQLPLGQRALGVYILAMPFAMAFAWLLIPVALVTAAALKAPVPITLISFLPTIPMLCMLGVDVVGLGEFCKIYRQRPAFRDYVRLVLGLPFYQGVLTFAAARSVIREARGIRLWEKTQHLGLHLERSATYGELALAGTRRRVEPARLQPALADAVGSQPVSEVSWPPLPDVAAPLQDVDFARSLPDEALVTGQQPPESWLARIDFWSANGADTSIDGEQPEATEGAGYAEETGVAQQPRDRLPAPVSGATRQLIRLRTDMLARVARHDRIDIAVQALLVSVLGYVQWTNMLHWPAALFDEGTYVGNAWAVGTRGVLGFYTYTYGHPPLGWILIWLWTSAGKLFGYTVYSLQGARELMGVLAIVSFALLYTLGRRLRLNPAIAALAVILFALSPLALFFHRGILLDNPATVLAIAAFVLALSPRRSLWSFAGSGVCFAASVLSKETTLVLLPALLLAAVQNTDPRTRRYCMAMLGSFFILLALCYPLYATLKGELLPGPGHVSLVGTDVNMLFTRQGTGNVLDPRSIAHGTVTFWLSLDPWLVWSALALSPIALARRSTRAIAVAYLIQVLMVLRPGYLPAMYVIALLPFGALIVATAAQTMAQLAASGWRRRKRQQSHPSGGWEAARSRLAHIAVWAVSGASVIVLSAIAATAVRYVAPAWIREDRAALTTRPDGSEVAAGNWLVQHVGHRQRLIVSDDFWIYLIEHGFDSHPVKGGFNSRTVVSYWPLDKDPAVRKYFPYSWREFNYIVSTGAMRDTAIYVPSTAAALQHSRPVAVFGSGYEQIQIRAITPTPLTEGKGPTGRTQTYRTPSSGGQPSLRQVAHALRVSVRDVIAVTDNFKNSPQWWQYEGARHYSSPLPPGTELYYVKATLCGGSRPPRPDRGFSPVRTG